MQGPCVVCQAVHDPTADQMSSHAHNLLLSAASSAFDDDNAFVLGPPTMRGAIIFSGSSHPALVDGICERLGSKRGTASLGKFANGETSVSIRTLSGAVGRLHV
jgi:hypothetical protein